MEKKRKLNRPDESSDDEECQFLFIRKTKKPKYSHFNQQFVDSDDDNNETLNDDSSSASDSASASDSSSNASSQEEEDTSNLEHINLSDIRYFCKWVYEP